MEWVDVNERMPDVKAGKFRVKKSSGEEINAFFYMDSVAWIAFYGQKTGHWWEADHSMHARIDNVTHWKEIQKRLE